MSKRILPIAFIFVATCLAWYILGSAVWVRTENQDVKLREAVGQMWGSIQQQPAPTVTCSIKREREFVTYENNQRVTKREIATDSPPAFLESSDIRVELGLDHRKKGLLWYSTYQVIFDGTYSVTNHYDTVGEFRFVYSFPTARGVYDSFVVEVDGSPVDNLEPSSGKVVEDFLLKPGQTRRIRLAYKSQGLDEWWYVLGSDVSQVRNFRLQMETDFADIDFPQNSMSPTEKASTENGWLLTWQYSNLISSIQIGMDLPQKLNPGPFIKRLNFFAPVSLFLFFFLIFMISAIKRIQIHPMNYFFLAAAFFSFHLLLAYLVDHLDLHVSMALSALVSMFLVISYMRLVVGIKFALLETGISQFVYLILFSYAFLLEGFTGLTITICCIVTLFIVMQFTGRIDWDKQLAGVKPYQTEHGVKSPGAG